MFGNWEDMLMGLSLAGAVIVGMTLHNIRAPEITTVAMAAEEPATRLETPLAAKPKLSFTVTGKRMPKECKVDPVSTEIAERCEALRSQTRVDVKANK